MKIIKKISLLSIILILFFSLFYYRLTFNRTEKFIPQDTDILFKINDAKKFLFSDKNKKFYNFILTQKKNQAYFELLSDMRITLDTFNNRLIDFLNGNCDIAYFNNNKIVVAFNYKFKGIFVNIFLHIAEKYLSDSTYFKLTSYTTNNRKIYILFSKKLQRNYFFCMHKNILVFANDKKFLETTPESILNDSDYSYVNANLKNSNNLRVFFNLKNRNKKNSLLNNKFFNLKYIGLYVDDFKTFIKIEGFVSISFKNKKFESLLVPFNEVSSVLNFMPMDINGFYAVKFKNAKLFYKYLINNFIIKNKKKFNAGIHDIENYLGMNINQFLYSWLGNEIIIANFKNSKIQNKLFFMKIKNYQKLRKVLTFKESSYLSSPDVTVYMKHKIYQLNLTLFYKTLKFIFNKKLDMPYFIIFNDYFVLSYNKKLLKNLLRKYEYDDILLYSDIRMTDSLKNYQQDKMFFYWYFNSTAGALHKFNFINNIYDKGLLGISRKRDGMKINISLFYSDKIQPMLLPYWPISLRYKIYKTPMLTKLYDPDKYRILSIDKTAVVRIFDVYGNKLTTVDLNKYKHKIKKVFGIIYEKKWKEYVLLILLKNNSIINFLMRSRKEFVFKCNKKFKTVIFNHHSRIFIYYGADGVLIRDLYGNNINNFSLPYDKKIKFLNTTDEDKPNNLIFLFVTKDNFIIKYKFKKNKFIELFAYRNKFNVAYTLMSNFVDDGTIILLSKKGGLNLINKFGEKLKFKTTRIYDKFINPPMIANLFNKKKLVLFSKNKKMYVINKYGDIENIKNMEFKIKKGNSVKTIDLNKDGTNEFVFVTVYNKIYITNKDTEIIYKVSGNKLPVIKDINNDNILDLIVNRGNKIYMYMLLGR